MPKSNQGGSFSDVELVELLKEVQHELQQQPQDSKKINELLDEIKKHKPQRGLSTNKYK
jgi:hypothetical protein